MVVIGGVEAALREGRWDKKAWRDAEDTREAAVGWLLAAAGGNLAANGNELATKLVEDGFDTWAAMDLSEQELADLGFNRGGARSFATECRSMREARGILERPQSLAMQEMEEEGPGTPLVQAMAVAKAQGRKRVTVPAFPSTDTAGVKGCGVGPMPEKQLAVAWVVVLMASMRSIIATVPRQEKLVAAIKSVRNVPTKQVMEQEKAKVEAEDNAVMHREMMAAMTAPMILHLPTALTEGTDGLAVLQAIFEPMHGATTGAIEAAIEDFETMPDCRSAAKLPEWLREYDTTVDLLASHNEAPSGRAQIGKIRKCTSSIKAISDALSQMEREVRRKGLGELDLGEVMAEVRAEARAAEALAVRAKGKPKMLMAEQEQAVIKPVSFKANQCTFWRKFGDCKFHEKGICRQQADHTEAVRGMRRKPAPKPKPRAQQLQQMEQQEPSGDIQGILAGIRDGLQLLVEGAEGDWGQGRGTEGQGRCGGEGTELGSREREGTQQAHAHHERGDTASGEPGESVVADWGSTVDVVGKDGCPHATNVRTPSRPIKVDTGGGTVEFDQVGDRDLGGGLTMEGALMAPWLNHTLVSIKNRMKQGWQWAGSGDKIVVVPPGGGAAVEFEMQDGLFTMPQVSTQGQSRRQKSMVMTATARRQAGREARAAAAEEEAARKQAKRDQVEARSAPVVQAATVKAAVEAFDSMEGAGVTCGPTAGAKQPKKASAKTRTKAQTWANRALLATLVLGPLMLSMPIWPILVSGIAAGNDKEEVEWEKAGAEHTKTTQRVHRRRPLRRAKVNSGLEWCPHYPHNPDCDACKRARLTSKPGRRRHGEPVRGADKGYVLGIDYLGPFEPDLDGNSYALIGVDARTNYGMVRLVPNKDADTTRDAVMDMRRELRSRGEAGIDLVRVHSDYDGSFQAEFREWLTEIGVEQSDTGGYRPKNNARAERRIRMVTEAFRAMLLEAAAGVGEYDAMWGMGLKRACTVINNAYLDDGTSPEKELTGKEYEWGKEDHPFGAHCIYWRAKEQKNGKFDTPGKLGVWVGRSVATPDAAVVVPVKWDAAQGVWELGKPLVAATVKVTDGDFPLRNGPEGTVNTTEENAKRFYDKYNLAQYERDQPDDEEYQVDGEDPVSNVEKITGKKREKRVTMYRVKWVGWKKESWEPLKNLVNDEYDCKKLIKEYEQRKKEAKEEARREAAEKRGKRKKGQQHGMKRRSVLAMEEEDEDATKAVQELIQRQGQQGTVDQWRQGYTLELNEVKRRRLTAVTSEEELKVAKQQAIRIRMQLEPKHDGRKKARLIMQGFREPKEWDGGATDSPVVAMSTIRTMMAMLRLPGGDVGETISAVDVSTAFLQAAEYDPEEPPRYVKYKAHAGAEEEYYRLRGPLYGQRSAPLRWYKTLREWLLAPEQGFREAKNEPCVYVKDDLVVVAWVDDLLLRGTADATTEFYKEFEKAFDIKDPSYLAEEAPLRFVGFDITKEKGADEEIKYGIDQDEAVSTFIEEMEEEFPEEMAGARAVQSPMAKASAMHEDDTQLDGRGLERYQSIVGSLNYFGMASRYDIAFATARLSQASAKPTVGAEKAMVRVLKYLQQHPKHKIEFERSGKDGKDDFEFYSDSDHGGDQGFTTMSHTGAMFMLNGAPVMWISKKQSKMTAFSSALAEIFALSESVRGAQLLAWRAEEMGVGVTWPLVFQVDNEQSIVFQKATCLTSRLRGCIDMRWAWVQELRNQGKVTTKKVATEKNKADVFTKCLPAYKFKEAMRNILGDQRSRHMVTFMEYITGEN